MKDRIAFNKKLVLNQYILSLFGADGFHDLANQINRPENEGLDEENISLFYYALIGPLGQKSAFNADDLKVYDANIVALTKAIRSKRDVSFRWKYFQYLALLFTEIYLDHYFSNRKKLLDDLNTFLVAFNARIPSRERLQQFDYDDLRRIAFWSATGSGKTLIMHMNILQMSHYLNKVNRRRDINRILLVTPNEGLSRQHLKEMQLSGIDAELFSKHSSTLYRGSRVEIIDIHKLANRDGDKTVAVDSFEHNNFVLVDEGHRGSSGDVWGEYRRSLAKNGFAIEYSATLGQATANNKDLEVRYAKSILFDYSYRHFYGDMYGKDYRIFNLPVDENNETRELYLTACILAFYQQKRLFDEEVAQVQKFNIENPLFVFVGSSVLAMKNTKQDQQQVSDVIELLQFLARMTDPANMAAVIERIKKIIDGSASLIDTEGNLVFGNMFPHIALVSAEEIYGDMLKKVFNAPIGASLHLDEIKDADGEIALRLGNNDDFGIINVGDAGKLCKLCAEQDKMEVSVRNFTGSLFQRINDEGSSLNLLIGSKRFTEGWNSWRVSTMGMMNVGKNEGSQVIQLFGRGVRLRGLDGSLKRHTALKGQIPNNGFADNNKLSEMETLNIFGVRANYMEQFKKYLEDEGVPSPNQFTEIIVPVKNSSLGKKLKTIKIREGLNFKKDGDKPILALEEDITKVTLDYYPRIEVDKSKGATLTALKTERHSTKIPRECLPWIDYDAIFFDLLRLKQERDWSNLLISRDQIKPILNDTSWYEIFIPEDQCKVSQFAAIQLWQDIASSLMLKYCDRFYKSRKSKWEAPNRQYKDLHPDDPNFISEYKFSVHKEHQTLITQIENLRKQMMATPIPAEDKSFGENNKAIFFDKHLYLPLFAMENQQQLSVQPVGLNKGEKKFIVDLRRYLNEEASSFPGKEIHVLRNLTRGKGVGFFESGNFYPDFIMWVVDGSKQTIAFIDPKGIMHSGLRDPKLNFHKTIKCIEHAMGDENTTLASFIISTTARRDYEQRYGNQNSDFFTSKNILFQQEPSYINQIFASLELLDLVT